MDNEIQGIMHMLLLYFSYLGYSNDICSCLITHVCIDSFCICVYESYWDVFWFNHHFGLLVHLTSSLWCIFSHVFPSNSCVSTCFQGCIHPTFCVLGPFMELPWLATHGTPLLPTRACYLPLCATAVKVIPYDPLLGLVHQTVWGLVGTSYRGDPLTCWRV